MLQTYLTLLPSKFRTLKVHFALLLLILSSFSAIAQRNMTFLGNLDYTPDLSDVWGYVDSNGREYAIVGIENAVSIVDVTNPTNPVELHRIPGVTTIWRDMMTYGNYAYVTNEGGNGLLIIDLSGLPGTVNSVNRSPNGLVTAHDIFIDENGIAYVVGGNGNNRGALMLDLNVDPWNPPVVGNYSTRYVHDAFARNDTLWTAEINDGIFSVIDVSDKSNPIVMATQATTGATTHNLWVSDDGNYLFTTDEISGANIDAYDVSNLANIQLLGVFQSSPGQNVIPHNVFLKGDFGIISYYRDGVVIFDATQPGNMIEVGNYDTSPLSGDGFNGAWGVYPYLPSGNILASDIEDGLFVLGANYVKGCYLTGLVTDSVTNSAISAATVTIQQTNTLRTSSGSGRYNSGVADSGLYTITFTKAGYISKVVNNVLLRNGITTTLNAKLVPQTTIPTFTGTVVDSVTNTPIPNALVRFENANGTIYTATANAQGNFSISNFATGYYNAYAGKWGHVTSGKTVLITGNTFDFRLKQGWYDDFLFSFGWTTNGTATSGTWTRAIPNGTSINGIPSNPSLDANNDFGSFACVTGNDPDPGAGTDDVDGGITRLVSPVFNVASFTDAYLSYHHWFVNDGGSGTPNDYYTVSITNGTDTVQLENLTATSNGWIGKLFRIQDYLTPSSTMKIIVETADLTPGHIVEGGLDFFQAFDSIVPLLGPSANFTSNAQSLCPGNIVTFTDLSTDDPATWAWSFPGAIPSSATLQNPQVTYLNPGVYDATLVVSNGIGADTLLFTNYITVLEAPAATYTAVSPTCTDGADGSATIAVTGNFAPFTALWSNGANTLTANDLSAGSYTATVTDNNGCTAEILVDIVNPAPVNVQITTTPITTATATDGTASVNASNGTAPYTYQWSNGETTQTATGFALGQHFVTVTDANGCSSSTSFIIDLGSSVGNVLLSQIKHYPNPFSGVFTLEVPMVSNPNTNIRIFHVTGQLLESYNGTAPFSLSIGKSLPTGIFIVEVVQGQEKAILRIIKTND